ncbi:MAG TPA: hypothetical protein VF746_03670 [Longimicrobium sp.]|jgi:hypothetical protein
MYTRCTFCHAALAANQTLEHFQVGRKIAFDPARGRLWAICIACGRWNLAPIEERWEALDELERVAADRARLLSQTDNVALLRAEDLELVRVGRADLGEEAWWRYGRDLLARRKQSYVIQGLTVAGIVALSIATGGTGGLFYYGQTGIGISLARWWKFGSVAWRGETRCLQCGAELRQVRFGETKGLRLTSVGEEGMVLRLHCPRCGSRRGDSSVEIAGLDAEHLLRRSLAWHHFHGASEKRIGEAARAIRQAGSVEAVTRMMAGRGLRLGVIEKKDRTHAIALEIAVNEETERKLLQLELAELERRWKEEEEIAAIADRELSFLPGLDRILRRTSVKE